MFLVCCQFILKSISIHVSLSESSLHICIGGQSNPYNNTHKNIENIAVSVVIRSVILSFKAAYSVTFDLPISKIMFLLFKNAVKIHKFRKTFYHFRKS